ncbi:MAG: 30S ribosomal protein S15 [Anaerolineales bacterium]|nr:MAG: 30S ribosomal protein S15 [Anaerolineales bacterium]
MPLTKDTKNQIIGDYRRAEGDTGSTEVQIALLTNRIQQLTAHGQTHKKDVASRRGLVKLVGQRRRLLHYLRNRDYDAYVALADRLNIRRKTK